MPARLLLGGGFRAGGGWLVFSGGRAGRTSGSGSGGFHGSAVSRGTGWPHGSVKPAEFAGAGASRMRGAGSGWAASSRFGVGGVEAVLSVRVPASALGRSRSERPATARSASAFHGPDLQRQRFMRSGSATAPGSVTASPRRAWKEPHARVWTSRGSRQHRMASGSTRPPDALLRSAPRMRSPPPRPPDALPSSAFSRRRRRRARCRNGRDRRGVMSAHRWRIRLGDGRARGSTWNTHRRGHAPSTIHADSVDGLAVPESHRRHEPPRLERPPSSRLRVRPGCGCTGVLRARNGMDGAAGHPHGTAKRSTEVIDLRLSLRLSASVRGAALHDDRVTGCGSVLITRDGAGVQVSAARK